MGYTAKRNIAWARHATRLLFSCGPLFALRKETPGTLVTPQYHRRTTHHMRRGRRWIPTGAQRTARFRQLTTFKGVLCHSRPSQRCSRRRRRRCSINCTLRSSRRRRGFVVFTWSRPRRMPITMTRGSAPTPSTTLDQRGTAITAVLSITAMLPIPVADCNGPRRCSLLLGKPKAGTTQLLPQGRFPRPGYIPRLQRDRRVSTLKIRRRRPRPP